MARVARHKTKVASEHKEQSAMEYLMTYGWAILIIAVVLGAFFQLGIFNTASFTPRAAPGACRVVRNPAFGAMLEGICDNALPLTVGKFSTSGNKGGGLACMNVTLPTMNLNGGGYNTVSFWMYWNGTDNQSIVGFPGYFFLLYSGCIGFTTGNKDVYGVSSSGLANTWSMITLEFYNGPFATNNKIYINGALQNPYQCVGLAHTGMAKTNLLIGSSTGSKYAYSGDVANLQIYNSSLDSNTILRMYEEGMGGAPIELSTLVSWIPLNSNSKDYSGYTNQLITSSTSCSQSYFGSYSLP